MDILRVSSVQSDIVWENVEENLHRRQRDIESLSGKTDLVILPEMFTTGFTMHVGQYDHTITEYTIETIRNWSDRYRIAIAGSVIAYENGDYYNRGFFISPDRAPQYYDKKHLFRMGREGEFFTAGNERLIVQYQGWNMALFVCYDLRFPVWLRNVDNEYDILLIVANWPQSRSYAWKQLLIARAIENSCYVCGVNRIGEDGTQLKYSGDSMILDMKGYPLVSARPGENEIITTELSLSKLQLYRQNFPFWWDNDKFLLQ